jgi:hypothetical protein
MLAVIRRSLGPACARGDLGQDAADALVVSGTQPQQRPAERFRAVMFAETPGAQREAVQAPQERAVVDPAPPESPVEGLRQRALGDCTPVA